MDFAELPKIELHLHLDCSLSFEIVESAAAHASESTGIEARLILCTLRHFSEEQSLQTAQLVKRFKGTRVAALDIAGDEAGFGIDQHRAAFLPDSVKQRLERRLVEAYDRF